MPSKPFVGKLPPPPNKTFPYRHGALSLWLRALTSAQRKEFRALTGIPDQYMQRMVEGARRAGSLRAIEIERASVVLAEKYDTPIVYREDMAEGCDTCEFAQRCRSRGA